MTKIKTLLLCLVAALMPLAVTQAQEASYYDLAYTAFEEGRYGDAFELCAKQCQSGDCNFQTKFLAARILYAADEYKMAGDMAQSLLKTKGISDATKSHLLVFVGTAEMEEGSAKKAQKAYNQAVKLDPESAWALYERGYFYYKNNSMAAAETDMQAAIALDSTFTDAVLLLAYIAEVRKDYEAAEPYYRRAIALTNRKDARIVAEYASSFAVRGDSTAAVDTLLLAFSIEEENGRTGRVYNSFLSACPQHLMAGLRAKVAAEPWEALWEALLGDCLEEAGEQDSAYIHYQKAYLMDATVDAGIRPTQRLAKALSEYDDYESAITMVNEALLGNPNNLLYRRLQQYYTYEGGDMERALEVISALIEIDAKQATSLTYMRGRYHEQLGHNDEALKDYLCALKDKPDASEIILALAGQWRARGNEAEANQNYDILIRKAGLYYDADKQKPIGINRDNEGSLGPFYLPRALYGKGRVDDAKEVAGYMNEKIRRAIKQTPDIQLDESMMYNLACVDAYVGLYDDALDMLEVAIKAGYRHIRHLEKDSDFDSLRSQGSAEQLLRYGDIISRAKEENAEKAAHIHALIDPITLTTEQRMRR